MSLMKELPPTSVMAIVPPSWLNMGRVWTLANYIQHFRFCNTVVDRMIRKHGDTRMKIVPSTLKHVWEHNAPGAPIRRLIQDVVAATMEKAWVEKSGEQLPVDVLLDMVKGFAGEEQKTAQGPTLAERCNYHVHEEGKARCT